MGIAERREREKQQRRNDILDAAENVFFEKGLKNATMDEVAEDAELSKGTLYLYFKNKEELYLGITERALTVLKQMFQQAVNGKNTGIEKVRAIGEAYLEYSRKYANYFKMVLYYEMAQTDLEMEQDIQDRCHQLGQQTLEILSQAIIFGIEDSSIRDNVDPIKTAFMLQGMTSGMIQLISREEDHIKNLEKFEPDELMTYFFDFIIDALEQN